MLRPFGIIGVVTFVAFPGWTAAETPQRIGSTTRQRLTQVLPVYDPTVRSAAQQAQEGEEASSGSKQSTPSSTARSREATSDANELPPFLVEAPRDARPGRPRPAPLPVLPRAQRFKEVRPEPFETQQATEKRLAATYLSDLDRTLLNRFTIGQSLGERAKDLQSIDRAAEALNRLAMIIAVLEASGASPEEVKALREEYARLFHDRPR
jgi:hypothetical protein